MNSISGRSSRLALAYITKYLAPVMSVFVQDEIEGDAAPGPHAAVELVFLVGRPLPLEGQGFAVGILVMKKEPLGVFRRRSIPLSFRMKVSSRSGRFFLARLALSLVPPFPSLPERVSPSGFVEGSGRGTRRLDLTGLLLHHLGDGGRREATHGNGGDKNGGDN